jgi:hypothetical protein
LVSFPLVSSFLWFLTTETFETPIEPASKKSLNGMSSVLQSSFDSIRNAVGAEKDLGVGPRWILFPYSRFPSIPLFLKTLYPSHVFVGMIANC